MCLVSIPNYTGTSQRTLALGGLRHAKAHCSVGAFGTVRSHILHRISLASWSWSNCVLSMTPAVSTVLAPYFTFMRRFHIFPKMTHVPGHLNITADSLSRFKQPLPEPLTVDDFCDVRWQELLAKVARSVWH